MPQNVHWAAYAGGMKQRVGIAQALEFTNKVDAIAEEEDHHLLIITEYGRATVNWWTHKIKGLHKNELIMAAKTDQLL